MSLCPPARCGCAFDSVTLDINVAASGLVQIEMPDAFVGAYPIFTFADAAERDAEITSPQEGMEATLRTPNEKWRHDGSTWRCVHRPLTAYTPTIASGFTLGSGTNVGWNVRHGDMVTAGGKLSFGAGSAVIDFVTVSLPFAAHATPPNTAGDAWATDASAFAVYPLVAEVISSDPGNLRIYNAGAGGVGLNSTTPFAWANTDSVVWQITYPVA